MGTTDFDFAVALWYALHKAEQAGKGYSSFTPTPDKPDYFPKNTFHRELQNDVELALMHTEDGKKFVLDYADECLQRLPFQTDYKELLANTPVPDFPEEFQKRSGGKFDEHEVDSRFGYDPFGNIWDLVVHLVLAKEGFVRYPYWSYLFQKQRGEAKAYSRQNGILREFVSPEVAMTKEELVFTLRTTHMIEKLIAYRKPRKRLRLTFWHNIYGRRFQEFLQKNGCEYDRGGTNYLYTQPWIWEDPSVLSGGELSWFVDKKSDKWNYIPCPTLLWL